MLYKGKYDRAMDELGKMHRTTALYIAIIRHLSKRKNEIAEEKSRLETENARLLNRLEELSRERDFLQNQVASN